MDTTTPSTAAAADLSLAAQIAAAVAASIANGQFGKGPVSKATDKSRAKISFLAPPKVEQAFRFVSLQLELRGEAIYSQQDLLLEMLRAFLNYFAADKTMAHPILRTMKPQS